MSQPKNTENVIEEKDHLIQEEEVKPEEKADAVEEQDVKKEKQLLRFRRPQEQDIYDTDYQVCSGKTFTISTR